MISLPLLNLLGGIHLGCSLGTAISTEGAVMGLQRNLLEGAEIPPEEFHCGMGGRARQGMICELFSRVASKKGTLWDKIPQ